MIELIKKLEIAKKLEKDARDARLKIENEIIGKLRVGAAFIGTMNREVEDYKLKLSSTLNYTVDRYKIMELESNGIDTSKVIRWKPELNKKNYDNLKDEEKDIFNEALTSKPSKINIKLERN